MQIVWLKRDLRLNDHSALTAAIKTNAPILVLYILEPNLWKQPDASYRHYLFLQESLKDLTQQLKKIGHTLTIKVGSTVEILQSIHAKHKIHTLWSHQETWNDWTYQRDKKIRLWTKENNITWNEHQQHGVIRGLKNRNGWAKKWYLHMAKPIFPAPQTFKSAIEVSDTLPSAQHLGLDNLGLSSNLSNSRQIGGRTQGLHLLDSFLLSRGENYTKGMSSPLSAFECCSRLSPHIAFGTLSIREVYQTTEQRYQELKDQPSYMKGKWLNAMRSFLGRLRWHCHFIQKLEDQPSLEFKNLHPLYRGLRNDSFNQDYFTAWVTAKTGYPMIDACMRALTATGWLNFRMRAMLMSFASYHLWLPWRETSLHLARLFTDYEPGIHYSQVQMQSGTTGINSVRVYNPIKQSMDHDPEGIFIRRWIPELSNMQNSFIHMPWKQPKRMNGYPMPIVDEKKARTFAAKTIYDLRKKDGHLGYAKKIVKKHASRKTIAEKNFKRKKTTKKLSAQIELPL